MSPRQTAHYLVHVCFLNHILSHRVTSYHPVNLQDDMMGDAADRAHLSSLAEVEREQILMERSEAYERAQKRWQTKRRLKRKQRQSSSKGLGEAGAVEERLLDFTLSCLVTPCHVLSQTMMTTLVEGPSGKSLKPRQSATRGCSNCARHGLVNVRFRRRERGVGGGSQSNCWFGRAK
jgi:hypothetical protein